MSDDHMTVAREKWRWWTRLSFLKLPRDSYRVGLYLLDALNSKTGQCNPGYERIATDLDMEERAVRHAVAGLKNVALVTTEKRKFDGPNNYVFRLPEVARSDTHLSLREADEATQACRSKRHTRDGRSDTHVSHNLRREPYKGTLEERRAGSVAPSAEASPLTPFGRDLAGTSEPADADDLFRETERGQHERR